MRVKSCRLILCVIIILLLMVTVLKGEEAYKQKKPFEGKWNYERSDEDQNKLQPIRLYALTLDIVQTGSHLTGSYDYLTVGATRIRAGTLWGSIHKGKGYIGFSNPYYPDEIGEAVIELTSDGLKWELTIPPQCDHYFPQEALLLRLNENDENK